MSIFLNEAASFEILNRAGIATARCIEVHSRDEALLAAENIGEPVVLKILSADIRHKSDVDGVMLGVSTDQIQDAYDRLIAHVSAIVPQAHIEGALVAETITSGLEMAIGLSKDPQFGMVVMVGMGGLYLEVYQDLALRLAPVTLREAEAMIAELKIHGIVEGKRGMIYDQQALAETIVAVSELQESYPQIEALDINPFFLFAAGQGGKAGDAVIQSSSCFDIR